MSRYNNKQNVINASEKYSDVFKRKKIEFIQHKNIFDFSNLSKNLKDPFIKIVSYEWKKTDRLFDISNKFYGSPQYTWLILFSNNLQSEFELFDGTIILIYYPLEIILRNE